MKKRTTVFATLLMIALFLTTGATFGQNKMDVSVVKDCCLMKNGKMMVLKEGKLSYMKKAVVLENGTKIKKNGVCKMADGTKVKMKEGNCMDMSGKLENCEVTASYVCPMHSDVVSTKPGKCSKCGMNLALKK